MNRKDLFPNVWERSLDKIMRGCVIGYIVISLIIGVLFFIGKLLIW